jgi:hypothetical protein
MFRATKKGHIVVKLLKALAGSLQTEIQLEHGDGVLSAGFSTNGD